MNKSVFHACNLVLCARAALSGGMRFKLSSDPHLAALHFVSQSGDNRPLGARQWYEKQLISGVTDFRLNLPMVLSQGLPPGTDCDEQVQILCCFPDHVSAFVPQWQFNPGAGAWKVTYHEGHPQDPDAALNPKDNRIAFAAVLAEIAEFAGVIGYPAFTDIFNTALAILSERDPYQPLQKPDIIPGAPYGSILAAADVADVFGATGSWMDLPPSEAQKCGRAEDFRELSVRLFTAQRQALMYAVNSCDLSGGRQHPERAPDPRHRRHIFLGLGGALAALIVTLVLVLLS